MKYQRYLLSLAACALVLAATFPLRARAQEVNCLQCHQALSKEKVVHAALQAGCATCHAAIDATAIPHKVKGEISKGLWAEPPELCLGCHDKANFSKKTVHPALGMGCTVCHNPHSSKNARLLVLEPPGLCYKCHDGKAFEGKITHPPVAAGMCTTCHNPHASDHARLLNQEPVVLCLLCHADVKEKPHVVAGFSRSGHPLGDEKNGKIVADPLRAGRAFYCGSCHDPHKSEFVRLNRFDPESPTGFCQKCHKL